MANIFEAPRGVPEYLPPESKIFGFIKDTFAKQAQHFGFELIELPIFEDTDLYLHGVGRSTDIVTKEMYTFTDKGDRSLTLRPEGTAGVMRAVIQHGLDRKTLPVKLYYSGPFFRYERPQKGRYRQLQQFGVEAIGENDPFLDIEVIHLADSTFKKLGLKDYKLHITSLGSPASRERYKQILVQYLKKFDLDEETTKRVEINPLRVLDDKRPEMQEIIANSPLLLDFLEGEEKANFTKVLAGLDSLDIDYFVDGKLVRGLDYYTNTTFEFSAASLGTQSGIGGGGRYDGLMQELGGKLPLSGIGFGVGIDRLALVLKEQFAANNKTFVYGIGLDENSRKNIFSLISSLREQGIPGMFSFGDRSLKSALKQASKFEPKFTILPHENENEFELRTVGSTEDKIFSAADLINYLLKAYKTYNEENVIK